MAYSQAWPTSGGHRILPSNSAGPTPPYQNLLPRAPSYKSRRGNGTSPLCEPQPAATPPYLIDRGGVGFSPVLSRQQTPRSPPPQAADFSFNRTYDMYYGGNGGVSAMVSVPRIGQAQERAIPLPASPLVYAPETSPPGAAFPVVSPGKGGYPAGEVANAYSVEPSASYYGVSADGNPGSSRFSSVTTASLDPYFEEYQKEYYKLAKERKITNTATVANNYQPAAYAQPAHSRQLVSGACIPASTLSGTTCVTAPFNAPGGTHGDKGAAQQMHSRNSQASRASFHSTRRESNTPLSLGRPATPEPSHPGFSKLTIPSPSQLKRTSKGSTAPYQRLDDAVTGADDAGDRKSDAASGRRRSFCNRPCCCPCCRCCSNAVGCGLCGLMLVLIIAGAAVTCYLLFPGLPSLSVAGVNVDTDIFFGKAVTPFSLVSGGGGLVTKDATDPDATKVKLPLSINLDVRSSFRVAVTVNNITVTGFVPLPQPVQGVGHSVQIGTGGLRQPVTFPAQSTKTIVLHFTMEYDTADPTGASLLAVRDLFDACGVIQRETQRPIVLEYCVGVDLPILSWTGFVPSFNTSTKFNCPWNPDEIAKKIESLQGLADVAG